MIFTIGLKLVWLFFGLSLALTLAGVLAFIDIAVSGGTDFGPTYGLILMAAFLGIPSGLALWRRRQTARLESERDMLAGYLRSRDAIGLTDLARAMGTNEIEAEAKLLELIEERKLDLVFHPCRQEYLHRARIQGAHTLVTTCPACGAKLRPQVLLENEKLHCEYCNAVVSGN